MTLSNLLTTLKQVNGVARSSETGEVIDSAGYFDPDTLCAVAAVSAAPLNEVGDLLAAGKLERWYFSTDNSSYYGSEGNRERLVAVGPAVKNPEATSKALHGAR